MTEKEAKTKWCPQCKRFAEGITAENNHKAFNCIASECMWWVWDDSSLSEDHEYRHGHCGAIK